MTIEQWIDMLRATVKRTRPALELRSFTSHEGGHVLVFASEKNGRSELTALINDDDARGTIEQWPGEEQLVLAIGEGDVEETFAVVLGGFLYVASSEPISSSKPLDFHPWFLKLVGRPFPLDLPASETKHIVDAFFGSDFLTAQDISAPRDGPRTLPHVLNAKVTRPYRAMGYWGYGSNSFAFYETIVRDGLDVRLRLPFGGGYMDPDEAADNLIAVLGSVERIVAKHKPSLGRLELWANMGAAHGKWTPAQGEALTFEGKTIEDALLEIEQQLA